MPNTSYVFLDGLLQGAQGPQGSSGGPQGPQGAQGATGAQGAQGATGAATPFRGTYHVDPNFTGTSTGSESSPFKTTAAGFALAVSLGLAGATLILPPATTLTEDIVFPPSGGSWEITCAQSTIAGQLSPVARIVGSVTVNSTTAARSQFSLTNLLVVGNISGNTSAGLAIIKIGNLRQDGAPTLTVSGSGVWVSNFEGSAAVAPNKVGGSCTGHASVAGAVIANNWVFEGGLTEGGGGPTDPPFNTMIRDCQLGSTNGVAVPINLNGTGLNAYMWGCTFVGPTTFTAANAGYALFLDGASLASAMRVGMVLTGTNVTLKTLNGNASAKVTATGNVGSTVYGARNPSGLYQVDFAATLLVAGTLGSLQGNVIFTDATGTLVTVPVGGTLNIAGAVGSKLSASLLFEHNGATAPIAFSLTGVTTAGSMSVSVITSIQRRN